MNELINVPEYQVSQFNRLFRDVIETNFSYVRIKGEISEIKRATRGQLYLILTLLEMLQFDQSYLEHFY